MLQRRWTKGVGGPQEVPPPTTYPNLRPQGIEPREVFTPIHEFAQGRRKSAWSRDDNGNKVNEPPPRIYVDHKTIIRHVDVLKLRRGDHCMITLNVVRCISPLMDRFVSFLGAYELFPFFHHFMILEDVDNVDASGIPRTADGKIVSIMEYANSIPEAMEELRLLTGRSFWKFPIVCVKFLLNKVHCHRVALADYGDMPHIFRVEENLTQEARELAAQKAEHMLENHPHYNVFWANCEHTTNNISNGEFKSPMVNFALRRLGDMMLRLVGLMFLHVVVVRCYSAYCLSYPVWALIAYYTCTLIPTGLGIIARYVLLVVNARRSYSQSIISRDDLYHLVVKELGRAIVAGGATCCTLALVPVFAQDRGLSLEVSLAVMFTFLIADMVYCLLAHLSIQFLLQVCGKFWFVGGSPFTIKEEKEIKAKFQRFLIAEGATKNAKFQRGLDAVLKLD